MVYCHAGPIINMPTPEQCIETINSRCTLLDCIFGFSGDIDPAPLGYQRDEIEVISLSGNFDWCTQILDNAVSLQLIPEYRESHTGGGGGDPIGPPDIEPNNQDNASSLALVVGAVAWLLLT